MGIGYEKQMTLSDPLKVQNAEGLWLIEADGLYVPPQTSGRKSTGNIEPRRLREQRMMTPFVNAPKRRSYINAKRKTCVSESKIRRPVASVAGLVSLSLDPSGPIMTY